MSEAEGLRVVVVNPRETKPKKKGGKKKMAAKKKKKKTAAKVRTVRSNPAPKKRSGYKKRRNPGFGFSGRNLAYSAGGAAGAAAADLGVMMLPLSPVWAGGIELVAGAALASLLDHKLAQSCGAVLMAMGGFKVANHLMAKPAGAAPAKPLVSSPASASARRGVRGIADGDLDGVGDFDGIADGDLDGVGDFDGVDAVGELEEGDGLEYGDDGISDGDGIEYGDGDGVGDVGDFDAVYA